MVTSLGGVNTSLGGSYGGMGVELLLLLLNGLPNPDPDPKTDKKPPDADAEAETGMGGMKSASGLDACGDWMSTLFVGDADLAFNLVGVPSAIVVVARRNVLLVGESSID